MDTGSWSLFASAVAVVVTALVGARVTRKGQSQDRVIQQDRLNLDHFTQLAEAQAAEIARMRLNDTARREFYERELEACRQREAALLERAQQAEGAADVLRKTFTEQVLEVARLTGAVPEPHGETMPASDRSEEDT